MILECNDTINDWGSMPIMRDGTGTKSNGSIVIISDKGLKEITVKEAAINEIKEQPFF